MPELAKENYGNHVTVDGAQTVTGHKILDGGAAIKGATSAVASGYVGQRLVYYHQQTLAASSIAYSNLEIAPGVTSFSLTTGLWSVSLHVLEGTGTANASKRVGLSADSSTGYSDLKLGENSIDTPGAGTLNGSAQVIIPLTISAASTNFYVKVNVATSASRTWIVSVVATRTA
jgi:hypothetical protein